LLRLRECGIAPDRQRRRRPFGGGGALNRSHRHPIVHQHSHPDHSVRPDTIRPIRQGLTIIA
jgi:hypothetical protein